MSNDFPSKGPARYVKKPVPVLAMQLAVDPLDDGRGLDRNSRSIAAASGWMMGSGFRDFRVAGEHAPFGIELVTYMGPITAAAGDWIVQDANGVFYPVPAALFDEAFEVSGG